MHNSISQKFSWGQEESCELSRNISSKFLTKTSIVEEKIPNLMEKPPFL